MKLKKGSKAAKDYMAKIRAKRGKPKKVGKKAAPKKAVKKSASHKDTKSHNVNIKVVSGLSKSKKLQNALKKDGLKLPHGYNVAKRKIGSLQTDKIKKSLDWINFYEEQLNWWKNFLPGSNPQFKKDKIDHIKFYLKSLREEKTHLSELKKLL